jgi:hypothetical protein
MADDILIWSFGLIGIIDFKELKLYTLLIKIQGNSDKYIYNIASYL